MNELTDIELRDRIDALMQELNSLRSERNDRMMWMDFSLRVQNALERAGIYSEESVIRTFGRGDVLLRGLGKKSMQEIADWIAKEAP